MAGDYIDFSRFEVDDYETKENEAQKRAQPRPQMKVVKKKRNQAKREMRLTGIRAVALVVLCVVLFVPIFMFVHARIQLDSLSREIDSAKELIANEQSEKIRLENEINAMMTLDKIEDYAENILGMVKLGSYNVEFCDFSGENRVLLSGGKSYDEEEKSFIARLLSYLL